MNYYNGSSYNNYNNSNGYNNMQNNYYFQYNAARENEKKALRKNATKLGITLLLYNIFIELFVLVYYFLAYAYYNHEVTFNYSVVINFFRENMGIYNSSMFSMTCNLFVILMSLTTTIIVAVLFLKVDFSEMLSHKKGLVKEGVRWFPACMIINFTTSFIISIFVAVMSVYGITIPEADFSITSPTTSTILVQLLYVCIIGPIAEEFIYRGIIISLLKPFGKWLAVIVSAMIFGLMHGNIPQAVGAFCSALVFGLIAVKFNSIIPTIVIHILNNLVGSYSNVYKVLGVPNVITSITQIVIMLIVIVFGSYVIFKYGKYLKIGKEFSAIGKTSDKCVVVFTNGFMLIYIAILLFKFISSFIMSN